MHRGNRNLPSWPGADDRPGTGGAHKHLLELWIRIVIATLALLLLAVTVARAAEGPYYVRGTKVNLREAPEGAVLTQLDQGEKLFVVERSGRWCLVSLPVRQARGWMHCDYIEEREAAATAESAAEPPPPRGVSRAESMEPLDGATEVTLAGTEAVAAEQPTAVLSASATQSAGVRFASGIELTSPSKLGDVTYRPAGGHKLANITARQVNLREQPSLSSAVVGQVDAGDRAHVITNSDPWYLVSVPARNLRGWVFGEFVDTLPRVEITGDNVRLREAPGLNGRVREQLSRGDVFHRIGERDGWVEVASSASGLSGWVAADYVRHSDGSVSRPYTVSGDQVNFRAYPAVDGDVMARLPLGATVHVLGRNEKWAYVYFEGYKGWMYSEYLAPVGDNPGGTGGTRAVARAASVTPGRTLSWKQVGGASIGSRLIQRAEAMMHTPYVWGGSSDNGVDCSGLIYKLLCDEGAKCLPRRASEQMAGLGLAVDKEELEPGDLVFFTTYKEGPSHVGIYLGDGDFIHASSAQRRVTVSNMSEGYYRTRFVGARRITEEQLRQMQ